MKSYGELMQELKDQNEELQNARRRSGDYAKPIKEIVEQAQSVLVDKKKKKFFSK